MYKKEGTLLKAQGQTGDGLQFYTAPGVQCNIILSIKKIISCDVAKNLLSFTLLKHKIDLI
jgi:hypothetical protein